MVYDNDEDQYKMYMMDEVKRIAREARFQGIYIGIALTTIVLTLYNLWRVFG